MLPTRSCSQVPRSIHTTPFAVGLLFCRSLTLPYTTIPAFLPSSTVPPCLFISALVSFSCFRFTSINITLLYSRNNAAATTELTAVTIIVAFAVTEY